MCIYVLNFYVVQNLFAYYSPFASFFFYLLVLYLVPNSLMKICRQLIFTLCCLLLTLLTYSQKKYAFVSGKVFDENENPLSKVSVVILGRQSGIVTSDSGTFRLKV